MAKQFENQAEALTGHSRTSEITGRCMALEREAEIRDFAQKQSGV